jgi:ParB family chromosome partitioning protein
MAQLQVSDAAGWNAGQNYYAKLMPVSEIVEDPELSGFFKRADKLVNEIAENMKTKGYDKSQPIVVIKGRNIVVDGHTRLEAAKKAGLTEIPAYEAEFEDIEDAMFYEFERQADRRNLTGGEILQAAKLLDGRKKKDGQGRQAELIAERLGLSPAYMYMAKKVVNEAPPEMLEKIKSGEQKISQAYHEITGHTEKKATPQPDVRQDATPAANDPVTSAETIPAAQDSTGPRADETAAAASVTGAMLDMPEIIPEAPALESKHDVSLFTGQIAVEQTVQFFKAAVKALVEANQTEAALILIRGLLAPGDQEAFCSLLDRSLSDKLQAEVGSSERSSS